jgi:PAS domain S-box-containing protein
MTIQRRIQMTAVVLVLFVLAAISTLFWSSRQVEHGIKRTETTSQAVRNAFMLKTLMDEYLDHGSERVLRQWDKLSKTLGQILDYEVISESIERPLLEDLKKAYRSVNYLYPRVVEMRASFDQNQDLKTKKMLTNLMSLQLEQLVIAANNLNEGTQLLTLNRRYLVQQLIVALGISTVLIILINIYLIRKSVVRPLQALSAGAESIGAGNFEQVAETKSDDEVGKLSQAFNTMVERLGEREMALAKARDELELRVEARTAELKNANERLEEEIEERKRAEEELRTASAYNRSLIEASLDPLVTISAEGKITDVNTATQRATGCSRSELIGTDFANYFTDTEKARIGYEQVFRDGSVTNYELAVRHKGGGVTPVMYNASIYRDDSGKVVGIFAAARDITDRKRAEEELTRSNADLQQFAYVASHDLQEPLRNVASCLQLLEKKYKGNLDAKADQLIHYAVESSVRMKTLIQDLLAYSRIVTKGKPPQRIDCELILDQTVKNLRSAISEAGAVITHDSLPTILADDAQLLQVFQNLIGNGIKFRRDEPPQIHVSAVKNQKEWIFSVKDNGIGIESRHLDRIFVIFQRLHKRSQYGGTGIGLAIVKKVVERHHGRVWVESEFGSGTTFYFTIPEKGTRT